MLQATAHYLAIVDRDVSKTLYASTCGRWPGLRSVAVALEMTGHGLVWVAVAILLACAEGALPRRLVVILASDVLVVVALKSLVKRQRPPYNDDSDFHGTIALDRMRSFPSGHASRTAALAVLAVRTWNTSSVGVVAVGWAIVVGASRVCMGRHYASDVAAGLAIGAILGVVILRGAGTWLA